MSKDSTSSKSSANKPHRFTDRSNSSYDALLRDIAHYKILSDTEEADNIRKAQNGDKRALDKLVASNMRFIVSVAKPYESRLFYCSRSIEMADLVMVGANGLRTAIERYDANYGTRLLTYAINYIRRDILDTIDKFNAPDNAPLTSLTADEAEQLDESSIELITSLRPSYTNEYYYDEDGQVNLDRLSSTNETPDQVLDMEYRHATLINRMHSTLSRKEEKVMLMYLGYTAPIGEMHPAQIATQLGCSIDTVQRLLSSAVKKLKKDVNLKLLAA